MTDKYMFGARSEKNLIGVNPDLIKVVRLALIISRVDFAVIEGVRTIERQREIYAQGRTKPGPIVTATMSSRHLTGHAVDLLPVNPATRQTDWNFIDGFKTVGAAMNTAADQLNIPIRWGWDWDRDKVTRERGETDGPHFELIRSAYP